MAKTKFNFLDSKLKKLGKEKLQSEHSFDLNEVLDDVAKAYIQDSLALFEGNKTEASKFLGFKRSTFNEKCKKLGIE